MSWMFDGRGVEWSDLAQLQSLRNQQDMLRKLGRLGSQPIPTKTVLGSTCPHCGGDLPPDGSTHKYAFCLHCRNKLRWLPFVQLPAFACNNPSVTSVSLVCPECEKGSVFPKSAEPTELACPCCKANFILTPPPKKPSSKQFTPCPHCGSAMAAAFDVCATCRRDVFWVDGIACKTQGNLTDSQATNQEASWPHCPHCDHKTAPETDRCSHCKQEIFFYDGRLNSWPRVLSADERKRLEKHRLKVAGRLGGQKDVVADTQATPATAPAPILQSTTTLPCLKCSNPIIVIPGVAGSTVVCESCGARFKTKTKAQ